VWLIRTPGTLEREPSAKHGGEDLSCHAAASSVPVTVVDSVQHGWSDRDPSAQSQWPEDQSGGQPVSPASARHDDGAPEAPVDNDAAVAAYRLSVKAGNPLSERKLARMFGLTSRRWARARIAEARQPPQGARDLWHDL
jgi:hypothetical protein